MTHIDSSLQAKLVRRLRLVEGQVRGLQKMIEEDKYCVDVITQTSAVKQALTKVEDILLANHLDSCVWEQVANGSNHKVREEILKVYKLKK